MSHAAHFLRRLDRVSDAHCELALTLYRDSELLKEVLSAANVPEGAPRLALSLDDFKEGPFVVVTREGRFVTCLGAGMRATGLPVVSRQRLDVAIGRVQRMRDEVARVRHLAASGAEGLIDRAFRRMQQRGPRFAREDAQLILEVQPLIARDLRRVHRDLARIVRDERDRVLATRFERPSDREAEIIVAYGDVVWGASNLSVLLDYKLTGYDDEEWISLERDSEFLDAELTFVMGTMCHAHRALWKIAQSPKAMLQRLKRPMAGMDVRLLRLFRELGLATVACASTKLRAEAIKALGMRQDDDTPLGRHLAEMTKHARDMVLGLTLGDVEQCHSGHIETGRDYAASLANGGRPTEAQRAEVPDEIARAAYASSGMSWLRPERTEHIGGVAAAIPWLAHAKPEELFLPQAWTERVVPARGVYAVVEWLGPFAKEFHSERCQSVRRETAKIGRNAECPCGSGKKHKRCCAVVRSAA